MADAYIGQVAPGLSGPHRVGEAEVGVAHHAEDMGYAPGDHGLHQYVGDRPVPGPFDR